MSVGFKISIPQKALCNKIIERVMKEKSLEKGDAFVYILQQYENMKIDNKSGDYVAPNVRDVLTQIKSRCGYLSFRNDVFYCLETMAKKKESTLLEGEPETVLKHCIACIQYKLEQETIKRNTEMRKESIKKLQKFMKDFITISKSGFKYTAFMCLCDAESGNIIFSRGGDSLQCPLLDKELANIQLTCMEKINPKTQKKPCEYLASLEGIQALDPTIFKDMSDIFSEDTILPLRENELEDIKKQNERLGIDVEAKVIEKEKDNSYDGECPIDNEYNQSCINPKCEHSDKCDSYSPDEKWIKEPLRK